MSWRATVDGIGAVLRAERERRYLSLDAVCRGTLVRIEFLQAIEEDRMRELPSGAYAKGFIRSYAAFLGLDPAPFLRSYEEHYAPPTPELSRVVRRGVRVPPDVQRRAWTVAVGSALGLLVLLGVLGVFRSEGAPAEVPEVVVLSSEVTNVPARNPMGAVVRVDVIGEETWVEVTADGQPVFAQTMTTGETKTFKGAERVEIFVARGQEIQILTNGRAVGTPEPGPYRAVFTPSTYELPPHLVEVSPGDEPAQDAVTEAQAQ